MDARIWHGVYPTIDERKVMVPDSPGNTWVEHFL